MRAILKKQFDFVFLLAITFFFFLLRLPSLNEPYWYGDEGIYQVIGLALRNGRSLYTEIWDNKPPLLYLSYALFNGDQFLVRAFSLIFGLAAVIAFYFLATKLFQRKAAVMISTFIFALLFGIPMFEGNIANAENFMLFPVILAAYLIHSTNSPRRKRILTAGLLLGTAFLFKIVAVFDMLSFAAFLKLSTLPALTSYVALRKSVTRSHIVKAVHLTAPLIIGFLIPFLLTSLFFLITGGLPEFLQASFFNNVGYVGYGNRYVFPQGLLLGKLILLCLYSFVLWWKKDKLSKESLFILLWLGFALFSAFFSQRPYSHYVLVLLPAFSLSVGLIFTLKKKMQLFLVALLFLISSVVFYSFWHQTPGKTVAYYNNFLQFILNKKSVHDYQAFFDRRVPGDYDVANYLNARLKPSDQVFIWGNTGQLYKMVNRMPPGKYIVQYHMTANDISLKESIDALEKVKPRFIVVLPDQDNLPFYLSPYTAKVTIDNMTIYERTL